MRTRFFRSWHGAAPGRCARVALLAMVLASATLVAACGGGDKQSTTSASGGSASGSAQRGGTLKLLGATDVTSLDTLNSYYVPAELLLRAFTRQLFNYPAVADAVKQSQLAPDMATEMPTTENGGISADGKTYTIHIKKGVKWDTAPPRAVTAADFVREFKMLCNPVAPVGAPGYFTSTISGMKEYCEGFAKVPGKVDAIQRYVDSHPLEGVEAKDDSTIVFRLVSPASDFLNIIAVGTGFAWGSARPVEYMKYLPDSPQLRQNTISDGPYKISKYVADKEIQLERNPAWDPSTDELRKANVDRITITEGLTEDSVQQQLEAGTADMQWDVNVPAQATPRLVAAKDKRMVVGPPGQTFVNLAVYLSLNQYAGPMKDKLVREAVAYAVDKNSVAQIFGGEQIAKATNQPVLPGNVGYIDGFDPFPNKGGEGDPAKAKALLAQAGHANGLPIKMLYSTTDPGPRVAQTLQASLGRAGFKVKLVPARHTDFYGKYLTAPDKAKAGVWDIAPVGWTPDWFGNNGRAVIQPLFTDPGPGSNNYGGYDSAEAQGLIDKALTSASAEESASYWRKANEQIMRDLAVVPVAVRKRPIFHSDRVQNCIYWLPGTNCDAANVWLKP